MKSSKAAGNKAGKTGKRDTNNLVALGSAAVLAIYGAGYARTKPAADRFANESNERRPVSGATRSAREDAPVVPTPVVPTPVAQTPVASTPVASTSDTHAQDTHAPASVAPTPTTSVASTSAAKAAPKDASLASQSPSPTVAPSNETATPATGASATASTPVATTASTTGGASPTAPSNAPANPSSNATNTTTQGAQTTDSTAATKVTWHDGVFFGWGTSRHGDIEAKVEIKDGRIISAEISQCLTRYSCSWIAALPPQVVARQSADVDYVSGATQSADAFYYAIRGALARAR